MKCSARMKQFIIASTPGINAELFLDDVFDARLADANVVLVDDPDFTQQITDYLRFGFVERKNLLWSLVLIPASYLDMTPPGRYRALMTAHLISW